MTKHYSRGIRRGRKVYYINYPRLIISLLLITALFVGIGMLAVRGVRALSREAAFRRKFSSLYIEEIPKEEVQISRCIVISAGHGGSDPGACVGDVLEKDINLSIAWLVHDLLREKGYTVLMTRMGDTDVDDTPTIAEANENGIDLYVAIHQNVVEDDSSVQGIETWYEEGRTESQTLAQMMQDAVIASTGAEDRGIKSNQSFEVTRESSMPSVLIETGFLSNDAERANLLDKNYQMRVAQGIVDGIDAYFAQDGLPASAFTFEE